GPCAGAGRRAGPERGVPAARAARRLSRTAFQRASVPTTNTVRTARIISWPMNRPQKRPYPDRPAFGASGQAAGRSCGAVIRWRMATGVRVKVTPDGHWPLARRPARPVAVHTIAARPRRKARGPISSPWGIPPRPVGPGARWSSGVTRCPLRHRRYGVADVLFHEGGGPLLGLEFGGALGVVVEVDRGLGHGAVGEDQRAF